MGATFMTENVLIALVIGLVILGAVYLLRDRLGGGSFSATKKGVSASVQAHEEKTSSVSGNKIKGHGNSLGAGNAAKVDNNEVDGDKNKLGGQ